MQSDNTLLTHAVGADVDSAALTCAEVKAIASGNPLVIEKAHVDAEVMRLTRPKKQRAESLYQMRYRIKGLADSVTTAEREIANIREDLRTRTSTRGDSFTMTVKKEVFHRPRESRARTGLPRRRDEAISIHERHLRNWRLPVFRSSL